MPISLSSSHSRSSSLLSRSRSSSPGGSGGPPPLSAASAALAASPIAVVPGRLFFAVTNTPPTTVPPAVEWFSIDRLLHYEPFFGDFGPLNLACSFKFCQALGKKMQAKQKVYYYCRNAGQQKSNAAVLLGIYCLLHEGISVDSFCDLLKPLEPFMKFCDASVGPSVFPIGIRSVLKGFSRALDLKFVDFSCFNAEEYQHFERVENGDLNLIVPGKFVAFAGPRSNSEALNSTGAVNSPLNVKELTPVLQLYGVSTVIRLNKKIYDRKEFEAAGLEHFDLFFPDGTTPSQAIVEKFMEICKKAKGAIGVHCKAGLGRTGSLIGVYLMSEYGFSAAEAIGWMRICRPGSVIGTQQTWLKDQEKRIRGEGEKKEEAKEASNSLVASPAPRLVNSSSRRSKSNSSARPPKSFLQDSLASQHFRSTNAAGQPVRKLLAAAAGTPKSQAKRGLNAALQQAAAPKLPGEGRLLLKSFEAIDIPTRKKSSRIEEREKAS